MLNLKGTREGKLLYRPPLGKSAALTATKSVVSKPIYGVLSQFQAELHRLINNV
jgi:hypothetical protein